MVKRLILAILFLGLIGGGLVWFNLFRDGMIAQIVAHRPQQPATVSTVEAQPGVWTPASEAIGTVRTCRSAGDIGLLPALRSDRLVAAAILQRHRLVRVQLLPGQRLQSGHI